MNNNYYQNPMFPIEEIEGENSHTNGDIKLINNEFNYSFDSKNIFNNNIGKLANFYMSYPNSNDLKDNVLSGIIELANDKYIIVSEPKNGKWLLLFIKYLNYIEFEEPINYNMIKSK